MTYEKINATIIGASKGLGKWIANKLVKDGFNVTITSRDETSGKEIAKQLSASYDHDNINAVKDAQLIIFCVPIEHITETIKEVAPHAPEGSLLMDIASVKREPAKALIKYAPDYCDILPCHPMFGPRIPTIDGQVIILTPVEDRCKNWYDRIINYLKLNNTHIVISSPEEHDKTMSVVQGITHFSYISIASTIKKLDISVKKSREFASPVYSLMLDMISRIVSQNPYLYYSIQKSNSMTTLARKTLIEESIKLDEYITNDEEKLFISNMIDSAKHLNEFEEALGRSDKAISFLTQDLNYLKNSIGKEVGVEHQYTKNIHVGILKEINADKLVLVEKSKEITLKISNINLLNEKEIYEWKKNNLRTYTFDMSVLFPKTCDENILLNVINNIREVISVELIDKYDGDGIDENHISLTFSYETFDKEHKVLIENYMEGIGGKIR